LHLSARTTLLGSTVRVRMVDIRVLARSDLEAATSLLDRWLGGRNQARLGEVHDVLALGGFGAWDNGELVGVATYAREGERAELAAIAVSSEHRRKNIATLLIEAIANAARSDGAHELWLVTTNDNLDALRLYQRRGFCLTELHPGAVDRARAQKPSIPLRGEYDIPIRDELVLTLSLIS